MLPLLLPIGKVAFAYGGCPKSKAQPFGWALERQLRKTLRAGQVSAFGCIDANLFAFVDERGYLDH